MTVSSSTARADYSGNGVTVNFTIPFRFLQETDLTVLRTLNGVSTTLILGSFGADGYTVDGAGQPSGGQATLVTAPALGETLTILRSVARTQLTDYIPNDAFPAESHERALDKLTMIVQEQDEQLTRSISLPPGLPGTSVTLPPPQALYTFRWNGAATGIEYYLPGPVSAPEGSDQVGFLQSGVNAVPRTLQSKNRDVYSAKDFGALGDNVTDDTAAIVKALTAAAGRPVYLPPGTYVTDNIELPSNAQLYGAGRGRTIIKRKDNALLNSWISTTSQTAVRIEDIEFDGNSANNAVAAHNILLISCNNLLFRNVKSRNAKGSAGTYGCGLAIVTSTDLANNTYTNVEGGEYSDNQTDGIYISESGNFKVIGVDAVRNTNGGISVVNLAAPVAPTERNWTVANCTAAYNKFGISASGFTDELLKPTSYAATITGNQVHHNTQYGIAFQSTSAVISGNVVTQNGLTDFDGGVLLNAQKVAFTGNVVADNAFYGVDAGGCQALVCSGNEISGNVGPGTGGCGINLGASTNSNVIGNVFYNNGGASGGDNISVQGYDGGTIPAFRTHASKLAISNNHITLDNTLQHGINVTRGDPRSIFTNGNTVYGGVADRAFKYQSRFVVARDNFHYADGVSPFATVAAAATLVIPDDGCDVVDISGVAAITRINTQSMSDFSGKVRGAFVGSFGSGYLSTPGVTLTGGGGVGATAIAIVANGEVRAIEITNAGSGYTSAPAVGFTGGGGGAGAAATAYIDCPNNYGKTLNIHATSGLTVVNGGNLIMAGAATWTSNGNNWLTLRGLYSGNWYEVARN